MRKYNLSKTTAWRAKKRGWAHGADYHQRLMVDSCEINLQEEHIRKVYVYLRKCLPDAPQIDLEDLTYCTMLLVLARQYVPENIEQYVISTARSMMYSYRKQGFRAIINAVQNWK